MIKKIVKNQNYIKYNIIAFIVILLSYYSIKEYDEYKYSFSSINYVDDYEESENPLQWKDKEICDDIIGYKLYPGIYQIKIDYNTNGLGSKAQVWDNENKKLLATQELSISDNRCILLLNVTSIIDSYSIKILGGTEKINIEKCKICSEKGIYKDSFFALFFMIFLLILTNLLINNYIYSSKKYQLYISILTLLVCIPFFYHSLPDGHDLNFHYHRIYGMGKSLLNGQFPVRLNLGFIKGAGYISSVLYPELFLYFPGFLVALGCSVLFSLKIYLIFINFLTGYITYYSTKTILSPKLSFIFTALWLLNPYRLGDMYIRMALGEVTALAFFPLAFWGIYHIGEGCIEKGYFMSILGISAILQSHIISVFLLFFISIIYIVNLLIFNKLLINLKKLFSYFKILLWVIFLNMWFIIPFVEYYSWPMNIFTDTHRLYECNLSLSEIFIGSTYNCDSFFTDSLNRMSLSIGFFLLLGILFYIKALLKKEIIIYKSLCSFMCFIGVISIFMSSTFFPWKILGDIDIVSNSFGHLQYSWRLLSVAALALSFITAIMLEHNKNNTYFIMAILISVAYYVCIYQTGYLTANTIFLKNSSDKCAYFENDDYLSTEYDISSIDSYLDTLPIIDNGEIINYSKNGLKESFDYNISSNNSTYIRLPLYNYGLYKAMLNDSIDIPVLTDQTFGTVILQIPNEYSSGHINCYYSPKLEFYIGDIISLLSFIGFIIFFHLKKIKKS